MNPIRYVENRIRGWLPEEPKVRSIKKKMFRRSWVNRRVMIFVLISITCLALVVGGTLIFLSWYSEQTLENLKGYAAKLEEYDGFIVKLKPLSELAVDSKHEWQWFSDFRSYAKQENITFICYDHDIKCLYYLTPISPTNASVAANIFYYNRIF